MAQDYIIKCWHCQAEFDAAAAADCGHSTPTKICPFCLKCFCDAADDYKKNYLKNCPPELLPGAGGSDPHGSRIGEILVKAGKITAGQLQQALEKQRILNRKLGEVLIMMSLVTPDELQLYLLNQKSVEKIDLNHFILDPELVGQVGKEFCLGQKIIPIEIQEVAGGRVLRFAFSSPGDLPRLKKRGELRRFKLIPYLARQEEIETLLKTLENGDRDARIRIEPDGSRPARLLNALVKSAVQARASDILFEFRAGQLEVFFRSGEQLARVAQDLGEPREFFAKLKEVCGFREEPGRPPREAWLSLSKSFGHLKCKALYYAAGLQENVRLRFFNLRDHSRTVGVLGLERDEAERVQTFLKEPAGLYLVAGPAYNRTGETMYALMNTLAGERIASVESTVVLRNERFFQIENQGGDIGDAVYKNLLFFKPDSMFLFDYFHKNFDRQFLDFVGQGKLFLELQGFSYEEIFEKLQVEHDVPASFLTENLRLVLFQRLVRTLCPACKQPNPLPARELFKGKNLSGDYRVFQESGCPACQGSGYGGDEVLFEVFTLDRGERPAFFKRHLAGLDRKISEAGNQTIAQKALNRVLKGEVSRKESERFF